MLANLPRYETLFHQRGQDMAETCYDVVFCGEITSGHSLDDVKKKFAALYKSDVVTIERKFFTGKPTPVKRNLDYQTALKYQAALTNRTGAIFTIEAVKPPAAKQPPEKTEQAPSQTAFPSEPRYNVVFYGEIAKGQDVQTIKKNLAEFFDITGAMVESMFTTSRMVLQENVDYQTAQNYKTDFEKTGGFCRIEIAKQVATEFVAPHPPHHTGNETKTEKVPAHQQQVPPTQSPLLKNVC
jgi:hypothetical protein